MFDAGETLKDEPRRVQRKQVRKRVGRSYCSLLKGQFPFFFTTVVILIVFKLTKLMALILDCHLETVLTCDAMQKMKRMKGIRIFKPICQLLRDLH